MDKSEHKKIGILGGTFDPPHLAHLRIAEEVREAFNLNKIIFIPAGLPPHKKSVCSSFEERFEMVKIAIENNYYFEVSDIEKNEKPSYTFKTLQKLKNKYPFWDIHLIIGWDSFCELETWWCYEKFLKYTKIIVVSRKIKNWEEAERYFYEKIEKLWPDLNAKEKVYFYKTINLDISGTIIRTLCFQGKSIRYLVSEKVYRYILQKGLYRK